MFEGSCVALVTPMHEDGAVDTERFKELVEWHVSSGSQAIVVAGSTGESATLTDKEQDTLLTLALTVANQRIPIIAGTGTNSTKRTIEKTQRAAELGADACLVVTPYYNRPTQTGLLAHYSAIAQYTKVPLLLYNVPARTGCDLLPETVGRLSRLAGVVGIKEATGDVSRFTALKAQCASDFALYTGDDPTACESMLCGARGVISITANIVPSLMQQMCQAVLNKAVMLAQQKDAQLALLHKLLVVEPNPIPIKWALAAIGKIEPGLRLPLTVLSACYHAPLKAVLNQIGVE